MQIKITGWATFWLAIFLTICVFLIVELCLIRMGFDTHFYGFRTPEEKVLQQLLIEKQRSKQLEEIPRTRAQPMT